MFRDRSNAALRPSETADASEPVTPVGRIAPIEMRRVEQEAPRETPAAVPAADTKTTAPKRSLKKTALMGALVAALALGGWYGQYWWTAGRFLVSTDDAYVGVHTATLAAKVPGYVAAVKAEDNAKVHAGDVVAMLDDGDYRIAVEAAHANIATQAATIERIGKQIIAQQAAVAQAKAQLASANAARHPHRSGIEAAAGTRGPGVRQQAEVGAGAVRPRSGARRRARRRCRHRRCRHQC